ncbi:acyltransferase [Actimicrobium antarcticum]
MIKSFEGVRGLAAIFVVFFHINASGFISNKFAVPSIIANGYIFVDLFFVLSGYVIVSAYHGRLRTNHQVVSFIIKRFGRLFPLLIFSTIFFVVSSNAFVFIESTLLSEINSYKHVGQLRYIIPSAAEVIATITFTHGLGLFNRLILNYASWSISTEFYAYLFFVFCWCRSSRVMQMLFLAVSCIACFVIADGASIYIHHCIDKGKCGDITYDFGFMRCVGSFILGVFVWMLPKVGLRFVTLLQIFALVLVGCLFYFATIYTPVMFLAPFLFAILIYTLSSDRGIVAKVFSGNLFQMLGRRSYSIYLLHPALLIVLAGFMSHLDGPIEKWIARILFIPILIIISGWSFRFIENPARDYFNRIAKRLDDRAQGIDHKNTVP